MLRRAFRILVFETRKRSDIFVQQTQLRIDFDVMPIGAERALSLYTQRGWRNREIAFASVSTARLQGSSLLV
jgi:hypothetical protein